MNKFINIVIAISFLTLGCKKQPNLPVSIPVQIDSLALLPPIAKVIQGDWKIKSEIFNDTVCYFSNYVFSCNLDSESCCRIQNKYKHLPFVTFSKSKIIIKPEYYHSCDNLDSSLSHNEISSTLKFSTTDSSFSWINPFPLGAVQMRIDNILNPDNKLVYKINLISNDEIKITTTSYWNTMQHNLNQYWWIKNGGKYEWVYTRVK